MEEHHKDTVTECESPEGGYRSDVEFVELLLPPEQRRIILLVSKMTVLVVLALLVFW